MHVPTNISLGEWIRQLIRDNKLYLFYKTPEWLALRDEIMADHHYECEDCAEKGKLTRADMVHHEYEVREYPDMALTRYVEDAEGERREVMHPLCNQCHNDRHGRTLKGNAAKRPPVTTERW